MREQKDFFAHLKTLSFHPATVMDVGVAWGTPDLYEAFPDAYYFLFEVLPSFEPAVRNILKRLKGEHRMVGLSDREREETIYVGQTALSQAGASIYRTAAVPDKERCEIRLRRLDDELKGRALQSPILLKTDCQGADITVIRGGEQTVKRCDVVLMEVGLFPYTNPDNQLGPVMAHMSALGFVAYDLLSPRVRAHDGALGQVDVAFVKADGPFRRYSQW
jgi:FkbM family methyltransferase